MENIGKQIKEIRDSYNLSQERFGMKLGVSGKTISAYENNKITPPLKVLNRIANVYKVNLYNLPVEQKSQIDQKLTEIDNVLTELKSIVYRGLTF